jgi:quinol monooxygenase YgiN
MILAIEQRVRDFGAWRAAFEGQRPVQERHGMTGYTVYRNEEDPDSFLLVAEFRHGAALQAYLREPSFTEVMREGGGGPEPKVRFYRKVGEADLRAVA